MTGAGLIAGVPPEPSANEGSEAARPEPSLGLAINLVFGTPFLWSLLGALRGHLWWSCHLLIGDGIGRASHVVWAASPALGSFWLGVRLMVTSAAARLVVAGAALLVRFSAERFM
jgi:hypothetical protein